MSAFNKTFAALSDPTRRQILEMLRKKDLTPTEIGEKFTITAPSLTHHLNTLREAGLVSSRREGQNIYYSLNLSVFEEVVDLIYNKFLKNKK
ncbi:MAG: autorepressor SdpR family transcription factor [Patescibacteria group bacterium]|jgi:DNA-binding transcriptional ArsR family regulator